MTTTKNLASLPDSQRIAALEREIERLQRSNAQWETDVDTLTDSMARACATLAHYRFIATGRKRLVAKLRERLAWSGENVRGHERVIAGLLDERDQWKRSFMAQRARIAMAESHLYQIGATRGEVDVRAETARDMYNSLVGDCITLEEQLLDWQWLAREAWRWVEHAKAELRYHRQRGNHEADAADELLGEIAELAAEKDHVHEWCAEWRRLAEGRAERLGAWEPVVRAAMCVVDWWDSDEDDGNNPTYALTAAVYSLRAAHRPGQPSPEQDGHGRDAVAECSPDTHPAPDWGHTSAQDLTATPAPDRENDCDPYCMAGSVPCAKCRADPERAAAAEEQLKAESRQSSRHSAGNASAEPLLETQQRKRDELLTFEREVNVMMGRRDEGKAELSDIPGDRQCYSCRWRPADSDWCNKYLTLCGHGFATGRDCPHYQERPTKPDPVQPDGTETGQSGQRCNNCDHGQALTMWGYPVCRSRGVQHPDACCPDWTPRKDGG